MTRSVHVRAPCRLHFGMFSFGQPEGRRFGGVGAMVDPPSVQVEFVPAARFAARGPLSERAEQFVASALRHWRIVHPLKCELTVHSPPDHSGLGVGTQLGLSVAAGLRRFLNLPDLPVEKLAASVGRGARSAIGTHGFQHGGLIVDAGKAPGESLGAIARRIALPESWRFVLVRSAEAHGLAGELEADAFSRLPGVPAEITTELWRITNDELLPAAEKSDFAVFGDAVYRFGRLAGECFAHVQGGPFASPETAQAIESIRSRGIAGVGQSSWGPTVFAVTRDHAEAESLAGWLASDVTVRSDIVISAPNNRGAQIKLS